MMPTYTSTCHIALAIAVQNPEQQLAVLLILKSSKDSLGMRTQLLPLEQGNFNESVFPNKIPLLVANNHTGTISTKLAYC